MKQIVFLTAMFSACGLLADTEKTEPLAHFSGEGMEKTKADFVTLTLSIHSECQRSPLDAQTATDAVVSKVDTFLQQFKINDDPHFKILVDGGLSVPFSRWHRVGDKDRELCPNTFQKITTIVLKLGFSDDFHKSFAGIQDFVLKTFKRGEFTDDLEEPRTYVTISTPYPEITRARRLTLEAQALDSAVKNAKDNFRAAIRSCEPHRWKVHSIREGSDGGSYRPRIRHYAAKAAMSRESAAPEAAPVRFDEIEINKNVTVSFQFEGSLCYDK